MTDINESEDKKTTWEKSIRIGGFTKKIKVREIENGFIIELNKYGRVDGDEAESEYIDVSKEIFSAVNPLADKEMDVMADAKDTAKSLGIDLMFE
jgi:hypothetical protein